MPSHTPLPSVIESEESGKMGPSSIAPLAQTQQRRRRQLAYHDDAIAATENMTQDAHLKKVRNTGRRNNRKQHASECE